MVESVEILARSDKFWGVKLSKKGISLCFSSFISFFYIKHHNLSLYTTFYILSIYLDSWELRNLHLKIFKL